MKRFLSILLVLICMTIASTTLAKPRIVIVESFGSATEWKDEFISSIHKMDETVGVKLSDAGLSIGKLEDTFVDGYFIEVEGYRAIVSLNLDGHKIIDKIYLYCPIVGAFAKESRTPALLLIAGVCDSIGVAKNQSEFEELIMKLANALKDASVGDLQATEFKKNGFEFRITPGMIFKGERDTASISVRIAD